jgi:enamine deaminase RidA (YjgF/YER057c/UK114 family)
MKKYRNPPEIQAPLAAYSHQVELSGPARVLVLSGQVGAFPDGQVPEEALAQLDAAFENLARNLAAADMTVADLDKLTFYLVGPWDNAQRRERTAAWLGQHRPAMTVVYVAALASPAYKVEIDAWASVDLSQAA